MLKTIEITGTTQVLKVRMLETGTNLSFSYGREMQYEESGQEFTQWIEVATYTTEHEWKLSDALNNEQGAAIVSEFAAKFNEEIVAWQTAQAGKTLDPNGTLTMGHLEFLYSKVAPVKPS